MYIITVVDVLLLIGLTNAQFFNFFNQPQQQQQQQQFPNFNLFANNPFISNQNNNQQQQQNYPQQQQQQYYNPYNPNQPPYQGNVFLQNQNQRPPPPPHNNNNQRPPPPPHNNNNQRPPFQNPTQRPTTPPPKIPNRNPAVPLNLNERISKRKCTEYANKLTSRQPVSSLSLNPSVQDINVEKCDASVGLVVGGENAKAGEFPHMAAIGYPEGLSNRLSFNCGGTLISENYVLTAAHCRIAGRVKPSVVRVGELDLSKKDPGLPELDIQIDKFISHEGYSSRDHKNDIALIKLKQNVPISQKVHPACLAQPNVIIKSKPIASGWGFTEVAGQTADILQKVELSVISNDECSALLRDLFDNPSDYSVDDTQMCAGERAGGKDTCQGDSGGPLQIPAENNKCMYILLGITSYGTPFCGKADSPGVYTRVSSYLDWIESNVWG